MIVRHRVPDFVGGRVDHRLHQQLGIRNRLVWAVAAVRCCNPTTEKLTTEAQRHRASFAIFALWLCDSVGS